MHFTIVNSAVAEFTGLDKEELTGAHITTAFSEDHGEAIVDATTLLLSSDERQMTIETRTAAASRGDHIFQTTITQKPTADDEAFSGVVCVSRDASGLKEHERRLSVLDRVLRHNLRNKMNIIVGKVALIKETTDDADILGPIERIESAGQELLSLGESARQFHPILEPSERIAVEAKNVADAARRVVAEIDASDSDSSVRVEAPDEAWARSHKALELSITELNENAIQHCETGVEVVVTVTVNHDDGTVVIRVTDDGPGIPERERRALMSGMESPLEHTVGLGLWFVRWMATNSGGSMHVGDNEPTGTVIEVRLPLTNQIDDAEVT